MLTRIVLTAAFLGAPVALAGQDRTAASIRSPVSRGSLRFDGGLVELHSSGDWGPLFGVRFGHYLDRNRVLGVVLSLTGAVADAGYGSLQAGVDLRLPFHPNVRPTLSGRGGLLVESEFAGHVFEATAGVAVRVGNERWLRLEAQVGRHGEVSGPRGFLIGLEQPL